MDWLVNGMESAWDGARRCAGGNWCGNRMRRQVLFFLTHISHYGRSAESLFGATCREQVLQHNGTLLAMYKIESEEPHPYVTGVVPIDAIKQMKEDESGWIFFDGGSVLFAVKFCHPYTWDEDRVFRGVNIRCYAATNVVLPQS